MLQPDISVEAICELFGKTRRPHLSLNYKTPAQAYAEVGEQVRVWKNYYKGSNPQKVASVISKLTSGCRTLQI